MHYDDDDNDDNNNNNNNNSNSNNKCVFVYCTYYGRKGGKSESNTKVFANKLFSVSTRSLDNSSNLQSLDYAQIYRPIYSLLSTINSLANSVIH
jgi:hypothetical protein